MEELFNNLMKLVTDCKTSVFFYRDLYTQFSTKVRIFGYHSVAEDDWELPAALETRGIMFEIDEDDKPVKILCRPMTKFFNLNENKYTKDLDLSTVVNITEKIDGSLVSTYLDNGFLFAKSKEDIFGEHAMYANGMLINYDYKDIADYALDAAKNGYTCDFEYVSPKHRIIVEYNNPSLVLLGVRNIETGESIPHSELFSNPVTRRYLAPLYSVDWSNLDEAGIAEQLDEIDNAEGMEGYVFELADGTKFKLKTAWYRALHSVQTMIENNRDLFELIVWEQMDDLLPMISNAVLVQKYKDFEGVYIKYLQDSLKTLSEAKDTGGTDKGTYAIKTQTKLKAEGNMMLFNLCMKIFTDGITSQDVIINELRELFMKNYKKYVPEEYKS